MAKPVVHLTTRRSAACVLLLCGGRSLVVFTLDGDLCPLDIGELYPKPVRSRDKDRFLVVVTLPGND